jgi:AraC-like DNA-binding protein
MFFPALNPAVKGAGVYTRINRTESCTSYGCKLFYLISGELTYTIHNNGGEDVRGRLSPGNLLYIPPCQAYSVKSKCLKCAVITFDIGSTGYDGEEYTVATEKFPKEYDPHLFSPFDRVMLAEDMESERDNFIDMCNTYSSERDFYEDELSARIKLILIKLAGLNSDSALPSSMAENLDCYIRENIGDEISNTELGAVFGYHPFYISRMLKDKKGITLHQYVISYRMKCAMAQLRYTDISISDIADMNGFTDASYFTKIFKSQLNMTPKEYRNKFKEEFV